MQPTANLPEFSPRSDRAAKRILDFVISLFLLIVLCPVFVLVALLVRINSSGPVIYRQKRVGRNGQHFDIYKFRTMVHGADQNGPSVTSTDDDRITPIGRWLRDNKLDELPQIFNVLLGDMSLVGPRPQVPHFVDHFAPRLRDIVLTVRPGITGPTALLFRHEERLLADQEDREGFYIEHVLPHKLVMDTDYVLSSSLRNDLRVLSQTSQLFTSALARRLFRLQSRNYGDSTPRAPYTLEELRALVMTNHVNFDTLPSDCHAIVADIYGIVPEKRGIQEPHVLEVPYDTQKEIARHLSIE